MEMNMWMQRMDVIISDWGLCKWSVCRFDMWCKSQKDQSWRDHDRNKSAYFRRCLMFLDITFNPHAENKFSLYKKKRRNVLIVLVVMWGHSVLLWLTQGNLRLPSGHWPPLLILVLICKCICWSNLNVITNATWLDEANKCARTTSCRWQSWQSWKARWQCFSIFFFFLKHSWFRYAVVSFAGSIFQMVSLCQWINCILLNVEFCTFPEDSTKLNSGSHTGIVLWGPNMSGDRLNNKAMTESSDTGHSGTF